MAFVPETDTFTTGIYQLETTDAAIGGAGGIMNQQAEELANRTLYLKNRVDEILKRLPAGAVTGFVENGQVDATTGAYNYLSGGTGGGGTAFNATLQASVASPFMAVFQNGRDAVGASVFYWAKLESNLLSPNVDFGTGTYPVIGILDTGTGTVTSVKVVRSVIVSPVQPTFATAEHIWINDRTAQAQYWNGSTFAAIVCNVIGYVNVTKLGTYTVNWERSAYPFEMFYDSVTPVGTLHYSVAENNSDPIPPMGGYILAQGQVVAINQYPRLFSLLNTIYNTGGEGAGNFRLPDMRAMFTRGLDEGRGIDIARTLSPTYQDTTVTAGAVSVVPNMAAYCFIKF